MFVIICRATVKPEKIELYESTFRKLRLIVLENEPGVTFYELSRVPGNPGHYRLVECYADQQTQEEHVNKDYYRENAAIIMDCLVDNTFEMEVVETI